MLKIMREPRTKIRYATAIADAEKVTMLMEALEKIEERVEDKVEVSEGER